MKGTPSMLYILVVTYSISSFFLEFIKDASAKELIKCLFKNLNKNHVIIGGVLLGDTSINIPMHHAIVNESFHFVI